MKKKSKIDALGNWPPSGMLKLQTVDESDDYLPEAHFFSANQSQSMNRAFSRDALGGPAKFNLNGGLSSGNKDTTTGYFSSPQKLRYSNSVSKIDPAIQAMIHEKITQRSRYQSLGRSRSGSPTHNRMGSPGSPEIPRFSKTGYWDTSPSDLRDPYSRHKHEPKEYIFTSDVSGNLIEWEMETLCLVRNWGKIHSGQIYFIDLTPSIFFCV
jgi:hypothetical protein